MLDKKHEFQILECCFCALVQFRCFLTGVCWACFQICMGLFEFSLPSDLKIIRVYLVVVAYTKLAVTNRWALMI